MSKRKTKPRGDGVRSWTAVAATMRNSAGAMGGSKRAKARRERQAAKRELRET